jgi:hypothetical protein
MVEEFPQLIRPPRKLLKRWQLCLVALAGLRNELKKMPGIEPLEVGISSGEATNIVGAPMVSFRADSLDAVGRVCDLAGDMIGWRVFAFWARRKDKRTETFVYFLLHGPAEASAEEISTLTDLVRESLNRHN